MFRVSWVELSRYRERLCASESEAIRVKEQMIRELGLPHHMRGAVAIHEVRGD